MSCERHLNINEQDITKLGVRRGLRENGSCNYRQQQQHMNSNNSSVYWWFLRASARM